MRRRGLVEEFGEDLKGSRGRVVSVFDRKDLKLLRKFDDRGL